ncbi:MAG: tetratricopeptide repeat protein [Acidimicrobiia bacterium]
MAMSIGRGASGRPARTARTTRTALTMRLIGPLLAVAVAITALGRFVVTRTAGGSAPASSPVATSSVDRLAQLEARVSANPDDTGAWQQLAGGYVRRAAQSGDPSLYALADRAVENATRLAPNATATLVATAVLQLSRHEFAAALETGSRAHASDPFSAEALAVVVDASVEMGRYPEATAALQVLLDLKPAVAALTRASYLRELYGDVDGARQMMERAAVAAGQSPDDGAAVATFLGDLALADDDLPTAATQYDKALRLVPGSASAAVGKARVMMARGDTDGAAALLEATSTRSPLPAVTTLLGDARTLLGDRTAAANAYALARANEELIRAAGGTIDLESALFEADHGDPATALDAARVAYDQRRTIFTADALAWSLYRSGRAGEAILYADEALRLGTRSVQLLLHAAIVADANHDDVRSADLLTRAFSRSPWPVLNLRADAVDLAGRVGVSVPQGWRS